MGERCVFNGFGQQVWEYWRGLPAGYPELEVFESVLMPNRFLAMVRIHYRERNKRQQLGFLTSRPKGGTSYLYGRARRALEKDKRIIQAVPEGLPREAELSCEMWYNGGQMKRMYILAGANGSGKSTISKVLLPTEGLCQK